MRKSDENSRKYFRAGTRIFRVEQQWFFTTREGEEGPFSSELDAKARLKEFLNLQKAKDEHKETLDRLREQKIGGDPKIWNNQIDLA